MSDCHRRVEMFLGSLRAASQITDRPLNEDEKRALDNALRYFREAAPKHTADEEQSLFPRLRRVQHPEVTEAFAQMRRLEDDHRWAAPLHETVERLGEQWVANGVLSPTVLQAFQSAIQKLEGMYRTHIELEDQVLFPLAARLLPDADKAEIAREMAARREVLRTG